VGWNRKASKRVEKGRRSNLALREMADAAGTLSVLNYNGLNFFKLKFDPLFYFKKIVQT
jgi:hypothetical protein